MRLSLLLSLAALLALVSQTSCFGSWEAREFVSTAVWADDDSAIALVVFRYEAKPSANPLNGTPQQRKMRHQLYVEQPNGAARTPITGELDGQNAAELYYMKSRGYFVLGAVSADARWFNRIGTNGAVTEIARALESSCQSRHFDVIPSPDGLHIAVLQTAPGCTSAPAGPPSPTGTPTGGDEHLTVRFLDAATLAEVQSQTVTVPAWGVEWTWRPAGDFVVSGDGTAWSLAVGRAPATTSPPACFWPKTSSSAWSSAGVMVSGHEMSVQAYGSSPDSAFGCQ